MASNVFYPLDAMTQKIQQKRGEKTRLEILTAAAAVFVAKGYEGASISDIAGQKGMNQSLIYHYFKDKKALWRAVQEWLLADFLALCQETLSPPLQKKTFFGRIVGQMRYLADHPDVLRFVLWQQLEEKTEFATTLQFDIIAKGLAILQKQQEIDASLSPEIGALFITSLLQGPLQRMCSVYPVDLHTYTEVLENNLEKTF